MTDPETTKLAHSQPCDRCADRSAEKEFPREMRRTVKAGLLLVALATAACLHAQTPATQTPSANSASKPAEHPPSRKYPEIVATVQPIIPDGKHGKRGGVCVLGLIVDEQGQPQDVHVTRPLEPRLDAAAIAAVRQYKFRPATLDGVPVAAKLTVQISFTITDEK